MRALNVREQGGEDLTEGVDLTAQPEVSSVVVDLTAEEAERVRVLLAEESDDHANVVGFGD